MLVLSRKEDQSILFPNLGISIEIVRVQGNKVSVGVEAPKAIRIVRGELQSIADSSTEAATTEVSLGTLIKVLSPEVQLELRDRLDAAGLAVHAAQKQCELGGLENAEFFLSKAVEALAQLNKMFESPQPADRSDCVQETPSTYGLASFKTGVSKSPTESMGNRVSTAWLTKPAIPRQLVEYLQLQLCSQN